jgi:hypothetical protein
MKSELSGALETTSMDFAGAQANDKKHEEIGIAEKLEVITGILEGYIQ